MSNDQKTAIKEFDVEKLRDLGLPSWCNGGSIISDRIVDKSRWTAEYELIFTLPDQEEGTAWRTYYEVGATENQDHEPWDDEPTVRCTLVEKRMVQREEWVAVGAGESEG
jgi:hypothetical protein